MITKFRRKPTTHLNSLSSDVIFFLPRFMWKEWDNKLHGNRRRGKLLISVIFVLISRICVRGRKVLESLHNLFVTPEVFLEKRLLKMNHLLSNYYLVRLSIIIKTCWRYCQAIAHSCFNSAFELLGLKNCFTKLSIDLLRLRIFQIDISNDVVTLIITLRWKTEAV